MCLALVNEKYDKNMKLGSFLTPYIPPISVVQIVWIVFTLIWFFIGLPLGPVAPIMLPEGII